MLEFGNAGQIVFFFKFIFFLLKINIFLYFKSFWCADFKNNFLKNKKNYFNAFRYKKHFEKQPQPFSQTISAFLFQSQGIFACKPTPPKKPSFLSIFPHQLPLRQKPNSIIINISMINVITVRKPLFHFTINYMAPISILASWQPIRGKPVSKFKSWRLWLELEKKRRYVQSHRSSI